MARLPAGAPVPTHLRLTHGGRRRQIVPEQPRVVSEDMVIAACLFVAVNDGAEDAPPLHRPTPGRLPLARGQAARRRSRRSRRNGRVALVLASYSGLPHVWRLVQARHNWLVAHGLPRGRAGRLWRLRADAQGHGASRRRQRGRSRGFDEDASLPASASSPRLGHRVASPSTTGPSERQARPAATQCDESSGSDCSSTSSSRSPPSARRRSSISVSTGTQATVSRCRLS